MLTCTLHHRGPSNFHLLRHAEHGPCRLCATRCECVTDIMCMWSVRPNWHMSECATSMPSVSTIIVISGVLIALHRLGHICKTHLLREILFQDAFVANLTHFFASSTSSSQPHASTFLVLESAAQGGEATSMLGLLFALKNHDAVLVDLSPQVTSRSIRLRAFIIHNTSCMNAQLFGHLHGSGRQEHYAQMTACRIDHDIIRPTDVAPVLLLSGTPGCSACLDDLTSCLLLLSLLHWHVCMLTCYHNVT